MPKYGGPGKLKKCCSHRTCLAMVFIHIACIHYRWLKCIVCYKQRNLHHNYFVLSRGLLHHPAVSLGQTYHRSCSRVQAVHVPHLQKELRLPNAFLKQQSVSNAHVLIMTCSKSLHWKVISKNGKFFALHRGLLHLPAASLCQTYHRSSNRVQKVNLPRFQKWLR